MAEAYSVKLRKRVVRNYEAGNTSYLRVGARFRVGEATVKRWVHLQRTRGDVAPKPMKRLPERIVAVQRAVVSVVVRHPGLRVEEINRHLGTSTKELALPVRKLIHAGIVWTIGCRRGTRYFARPNP